MIKEIIHLINLFYQNVQLIYLNILLPLLLMQVLFLANLFYLLYLQLFTYNPKIKIIFNRLSLEMKHLLSQGHLLNLFHHHFALLLLL
jgi:hypothetical protein